MNSEVSECGRMRVAYADPPYPGQSRRHYGHHPDYAGEVDHQALVTELLTFDAWALSTASTALRDVLALCPAEARVAAWVKPRAPFRNQPVTFAWEPVIYIGKTRKRQAGDYVWLDWVSAMPPIFTGENTGVHGTKPVQFCFWLFGILGMSPDDEFCDLFPGSGAVMRAWKSWSAQLGFAA